MQKEEGGGLQRFTSTKKPLEKVRSWGMKGAGRTGSLNRKAEVGYLCVGFEVWTEWPKETLGGTSGTTLRLEDKTWDRDLYNKKKKKKVEKCKIETYHRPRIKYLWLMLCRKTSLWKSWQERKTTIVDTASTEISYVISLQKQEANRITITLED